MTFRFIENLPAFITQQTANGNTPKSYQKVVDVLVRPVRLGEKIETILADGHHETTATAVDPTQVVVTNPGGEEYIISHKQLTDRYVPDSNDPTLYHPITAPQECIDVYEDVSFVAPWGEKMFLKKGGKLNITDPNNIYGIQEKEFRETYKPIVS